MPGALLERARALASRSERVLLGITGAPGAGKSTTAASLVEALGPQTAVLVPMDGFHLTEAELRQRGWRDRKGAWDTFDAQGYVQLLRRLRTGEEEVVHAPDFDRDLDDPVPGAIPVPRTVPLVVTEGNYLLSEHGAFAGVADLLDECWYLDLDDAVRRQRLVARHHRHGMPAAQAAAWVEGSDEANAAVVAATRWRADLTWVPQPAGDPPTLDLDVRRRGPHVLSTTRNSPVHPEGVAMPTTMQRIVVETGGVTVVEAARPQPGPDEVLVETTVVGVCGSDTHAAAGHHPFIPLPYAPGHEVVGVVRAVGGSVTGPTVGAHVTVEPTLPCWDCKMCTTGRSNICENLRFFGCGYEQGGMADFFTVPANRLHVLPEGMSDLAGALVEPLATPVHAVRLAGGVKDKTVVIIGAGTIGLLTLKAARHDGARRVVMTDPLESKRERALRLGADAVVDATRDGATSAVRGELGESADVVFDCVAVQATVDQAITLATKGGIVVIVGVPAKPVTVPLPQIQDLQVRVQGSATYTPEDVATAIEVVASGQATPADFITARFPLAAAAEAFAASAGGQEVKVVLTSAAVPA